MPTSLQSLQQALLHSKALLVVLAEKVAAMEKEISRLSAADSGPAPSTTSFSSASAGAKELSGTPSTDRNQSVLADDSEATDIVHSVLSALSAKTNRDQPVPAANPARTNSNNSVLAALSAGAIAPDSPLLPAETALWRMLRREEPRLSATAAQRMAKVLLRLCTQPEKCTQVYLAKMLGLSTSGMSKHMDSLQQRGLVQRLGYMKWTITAKAAEYMERAVAADRS